MTNPFWNEREERPRALWRLVATLALIVAAALLVGMGLRRFSSAPSAGILLSLLATLLGVAVSARCIDRRPFAEYGFSDPPRWGWDFAAGLVLGLLLMAGIFGVERAAGWVTVTDRFSAEGGLPFARAFLGSVLFFAAVAMYEELLFRSYLLKNLAEAFSRSGINPAVPVGLALGLSSALFGLAHAANPNASAVSVVNITLAGVVLGLGYVLTGRLALPVGFHLTWNFAQGVLFGFPVSGSSGLGGAKVLVTSTTGPALWTGGAFGPEGGLLGVFALVLAAVAIVLWAKRMGNPGAAVADQATYITVDARRRALMERLMAERND